MDGRGDRLRAERWRTHDRHGVGVIHTGDVTHLSKPEQFGTAKDILGQLRAPLIVIPGEHDFIGKDDNSFFQAFPAPKGGKQWFSWDRDRIARALELLGEKQREAIRLSYEEGLPYAEIAQRLNEPAGTIKSRLSNAVRTLRAQFAAQGETL